jgi:hypothetical protein
MPKPLTDSELDALRDELQTTKDVLYTLITLLGHSSDIRFPRWTAARLIALLDTNPDRELINHERS